MPNARITNFKPNARGALGVNIGSVTTTAFLRAIVAGNPIGLLLALTYPTSFDVVETTTVTVTAGKPNAHIRNK